MVSVYERLGVCYYVLWHHIDCYVITDISLETSVQLENTQ
jgi:hypothetical protein